MGTPSDGVISSSQTQPSDLDFPHPYCQVLRLPDLCFAPADLVPVKPVASLTYKPESLRSTQRV